MPRRTRATKTATPKRQVVLNGFDRPQAASPFIVETKQELLERNGGFDRDQVACAALQLTYSALAHCDSARRVQCTSENRYTVYREDGGFASASPRARGRKPKRGHLGRKLVGEILHEGSRSAFVQVWRDRNPGSRFARVTILPGQPRKLDGAQRQALARLVEEGPIPAIHGVVRWRLIDLAQWLWEEFQLSISKQTLSRELRAMGYRKLSARPRHHAQNEPALEAFKKTSPPAWRRSRRARPPASP